MVSEKSEYTHGMEEAADNALKYFPELVTPQVYNAIKCHMFPLNPIPPKYIEGWIITSMDKKSSINILSNVKELPNYVGLRTH